MKTTRILAILVLVLVVGGQSARAATANQAPIADAGLSRYAAADPVQLDGTGSYDPDSSGPLSYMWRQISGPPVVISDADTATPTISGFTQTDAIQECEFELVTSDGKLTSQPDTVKVTIVPDFGADTFRQDNPPFDPDKLTIIYFGGGDCITGYVGQQWNRPAWNGRANVISFPNGYGPDSGGGGRTYYKYGDMIIVYLSSVAPDYKQLIQTIGWSTGGQPAIDVGICLNSFYQDARYTVNRVTQLDAPCRMSPKWGGSWGLYTRIVESFLSSSVDGEQCWMDFYYGTGGEAYKPFEFRDFLTVSLGLAHDKVRNWYRNSLAGNAMNNFNSGLVAGAYWSVVGPGKNLQLALQTDAYYFRWDGTQASGSMGLFNEGLYPGRLPEPVTLVGPVDVGDPNGAIVTCEESENAVGYQLLFGADPHRIMDYAVVSDTSEPPNAFITELPFEQTWWTVKARDQYGSTIYADPVPINVFALTFPVDNLTMGKRYCYIQDAINDATPDDEIVVSEGICQENINFRGKNLTVRSADPNDPAVVAATVINGGDQDSVVTFSGGEEASCVLAGLTITGGIVGISCRDASPTIRNCIIGSTGAIAIEFWYGYEPIIINCTILGQVKELNDPRLLSHWKLDEAEGTIAQDSASDKHGTLNGEPTWQPATGKVDGALQFDGIDDYVSTPFVLNPADGLFSVFAWVKGAGPGQVVISQTSGTTGYGSTWLGIDPSEGKLITKLMFFTLPLESVSVITDDTWHRVGVVWDGACRHLYLDGIEVAKDTRSFSAGIRSDGGLYFGADKDLSAVSFWSGLIDDVCIYDWAVTP